MITSNYHSQSVVLPCVANGDSAGSVLCATLAKVDVPRLTFDATNPEHRAAYDEFRTNGRWTLKFHNEWPFDNVESTIRNKLVDLALGKVPDAVH